MPLRSRTLLLAVCLAGVMAARVDGQTSPSGENGSPTAGPDFDGDGFADLAIGAISETVGPGFELSGAGAVNVLYGAAAGLTGARSQLWHQNRPGIADMAEVSDLFGFPLVWGNFNGDGFSDLAIGVSPEDVNGRVDAGAVSVLYGSPNGLTAAGNQFWHQDSPGIEEESEEANFFGERLAPGDFNGDGFDDLAIGVLNETVGALLGAGAVNVLYGSPDGLSAAGNQLWHQGQPGIEGDPEEFDVFGGSVSAGDFNADGFADLAIGALNENLEPISGAGAVHVLFGSAAGLSADGSQFLHQDSPGLADRAERFEQFGEELGTGDFDDDGFADLVVGVPFEDLQAVFGAGLVHVLYGSPEGISSVRSQLWHQDRPGIQSEILSQDTFGETVESGDFNADGVDDLAIAAPLEDLAPGEFLPKANAGTVHILFGSAGRGLTSAANQLWHQDVPGIPEEGGDTERFGQALAAGDFDGDGASDLAVGVASESRVGAFDGVVHVLYGTPVRGLSTLRNQLWHQDRPGVPEVAESGDVFGGALSR